MIIAVDFDNVICGGEHKPIEGAKETIEELINAGHEPYVFTARNPIEFRWIELWLLRKDFPELEVTNIKKNHTRVYIDDRAIRFTNWLDISKYFL